MPPPDLTKRSREEIAEMDAELLQRTNRLGGGYQPIIEENEEIENPEEGELEPEQPETEEDSVIMRGDNHPIVDLSKRTARKPTTSKSITSWESYPETRELPRIR